MCGRRGPGHDVLVAIVAVVDEQDEPEDPDRQVAVNAHVVAEIETDGAQHREHGFGLFKTRLEAREPGSMP